MLEPSFFKKTIDEVYKELIYLTFYFQGEPYLNPNFLDMVRYASEKGIYTSTSTNAHYLTKEQAKKTVESKLDRLIISIDGTTQETYEQYRIGGNLQKVIEGTKHIVQAKKELKSSTPHIVFQFLVVKPNEHQLNDVKKLAENLGVNEVVFKTAQVYDFKNGNPLIPENIRYSRYKKNGDGTYIIKNKLLNQCWRMWSSCVITWDGVVVPCCFDKDAKHPLGDLKTQNFKSLWRSPKYQGFRQSILKSREEIDICKNCSEGTKVWAS
jgi:radical SAM protein with 4Fe4S-binding SPASM domain